MGTLHAPILRPIPRLPGHDHEARWPRCSHVPGPGQYDALMPIRTAVIAAIAAGCWPGVVFGQAAQAYLGGPRLGVAAALGDTCDTGLDRYDGNCRFFGFVPVIGVAADVEWPGGFWLGGGLDALMAGPALGQPAREGRGALLFARARVGGWAGRRPDDGWRWGVFGAHSVRQGSWSAGPVLRIPTGVTDEGWSSVWEIEFGVPAYVPDRAGGAAWLAVSWTPFLLEMEMDGNLR